MDLLGPIEMAGKRRVPAIVACQIPEVWKNEKEER
jgi:hypothetical protein